MAGELTKEACKATVDRIVFGFLHDPSERSFEGFKHFSDIDPNVLLSELLHQVEDAAEGLDIDLLESKAPGPDADFVRKVVRSVHKHDMAALHEAIHGDLFDLIVGLVLVIARLRKEKLDNEISGFTF